MRSQGAWLLLLSDESWNLVNCLEGEVSGEAIEFLGSELFEQADAICEQLEESGYHGESVYVGLDSRMCLAPTISVPSPQLLGKPQALNYHLEQWIPWSAEQYVADRIHQRDQALMVALRLDSIAGLITALEQRDVKIPVIAPVALLALQTLLSKCDLPSEHRLYWQRNSLVEVIEVRKRQPLSWTTLPSGPGEIRLHEQQRLLASEVIPVYASDLTEDLLNELQSFCPSATTLEPQDQQAAAQESCKQLARGKDEPIINLRREELTARRPFQATSREWSRLKLAMMSLVIGLSLMFWWQADACLEVESKLQAELVAEYEALFSNTPIPENVAGKIDQELRFLKGTRAPSDELPEPVSADLVLQQLLQALPQQMRFRFTEIRIQGEKIYMTGDVRSNSDADRIAASLRSHQFRVNPPRLQRLDSKSFSVRLDASAKLAREGAAE